MKKQIFMTSFILLFSQVSYGATWVEMPSYPQKTAPIKVFIDIDSVEKHYFNNYNKKNFYLTAWIKHIMPYSRMLGNGQSYNQTRIFTYVDCSNKKLTRDEIVGYTNLERLVAHETFSISKKSSYTWERVVPDTVGDADLNAICIAYDKKVQFGLIK